MEDRWTQYPDGLKKRIEKVNKMYADEAKERERWDSLTPQQQNEEMKRAEEETKHWEALTPDQRQAEIDAANAGANPNPDNPNPDLEPETVESLKTKLEKAEQKYRTLQGMIKEPAELERQNNILLREIKLLQDQLFDIQQQAKKVDEPKKSAINVREALKEHYDRLSQTLAPDILEDEIKKDQRLIELAGEIANQNITEVATKFDARLKLSAEAQFNKDLYDVHPNWKQMWGTPEFQGFLEEEDGISGFKRYDIISDAFNRFDSRVVIRAFNLFTGKGAKPREDRPEIDANKVKNRIGAPRSSGTPIPSLDRTQPGQISPHEARIALANLATNYSRGLFRGSKEDYNKEYQRLWDLSQPKGTG